MSEVSSGLHDDRRIPAAAGPYIVSANRPHRVALSALLIVLTAVWLTMLLAHAGPLDRAIFSEIYDRGRGRIGAAWHITALGSPEFLYAVLGIGAVIGVVQPHRRHDLILWLAISLTCRLMVTIEKVTFALPRPHPSLHHVTVHSYAFPSGHSANSMATYLSLALIIASGRWRPWAIAAALAATFAVGVSRIVLGVHWPTDVLGGWAFGCFWTLAGLWLADRFRSEQHPAAASSAH